MGPPTSLDQSYSPDNSSGSDSAESEQEEEFYDPDDCPNLAKLQPFNPMEPRLFNDLQALRAALSWPKPFSDEVPTKIKEKDKVPILEPVKVFPPDPDSEPEEIIEIPDIELEIPKLLFELEEPKELIVADDIWPSELKDFIADRPGADNELTTSIPALPEYAPGEPRIGQDKIIVEDDDHIMLEYEIEFPRPFKDN
jgi:hypothetical protein